VSISSNIAEGFGRESKPDKVHFYIMARGSVYEVQSQLQIAKEIEFIDEATYISVFQLSTDTLKLIHGLIRSTRKTSS
jgi:four helix bundle protein